MCGGCLGLNSPLCASSAMISTVLAIKFTIQYTDMTGKPPYFMVSNGNTDLSQPAMVSTLTANMSGNPLNMCILESYIFVYGMLTAVSLVRNDWRGSLTNAALLNETYEFE